MTRPPLREPKASKNRMHLDIETPDIHAEADRLAALGAQRVSEGPKTRSLCQRLSAPLRGHPGHENLVGLVDVGTSMAHSSPCVRLDAGVIQAPWIVASSRYVRFSDPPESHEQALTTEQLERAWHSGCRALVAAPVRSNPTRSRAKRLVAAAGDSHVR